MDELLTLETKLLSDLTDCRKEIFKLQIEKRFECVKQYLLMRKEVGQVTIEWFPTNDEVSGYDDYERKPRPSYKQSLEIKIIDNPNLCTILVTYPLMMDEIVHDFMGTLI